MHINNLCAVASLLAAAGCASGTGSSAALPSPLDAKKVISSLKLVPMPDDACPGYFMFTYESKTRAAVGKDRSAASLIYYLMPPEIAVDSWHIISSDEMMLYHAGAPLAQLLLYPDGRHELVVLGPRAEKGHVAQTVIPAGTWMGFSKLPDNQYNWGLYGVMVVPGWHKDDIRMAGEQDVRELMHKYTEAVPDGRKLGLFPR